MFPFQNNYFASPFPNRYYYDQYNQPIYTDQIYPFSQQLPIFQHQVPLSMYYGTKQNDAVAQTDENLDNLKNQPQARKKNLKKKLVFVDLKKELRKTAKKYKAIRKSLNYFDPCRAPPITTIRNKLELAADMKQQQQKVRRRNPNDQQQLNSEQKALMRLQIMVKLPDQKNYPFLICKKRKYYRNLKRRYSVVYFHQRAYYIENKLPIPQQLHPKLKNRRNRGPKNSQIYEDDSDSSEQNNSLDSSYSESCKLVDNQLKNSTKLKQCNPFPRCEIKQEMSSPALKQYQ